MNVSYVEDGWLYINHQYRLGLKISVVFSLSSIGDL